MPHSRDQCSCGARRSLQEDPTLLATNDTSFDGVQLGAGFIQTEPRELQQLHNRPNRLLRACRNCGVVYFPVSPYLAVTAPQGGG